MSDTAQAGSPTMLTVQQAAERLNVHVDTVRAMAYRGDLKAVHVGDPKSHRKNWRISVKAIEEFIESGNSTQPGTRPKRGTKRKRKRNYF